MELKKRVYNRRQIKEKIGVDDIDIKQSNRTQDEIRLYNRLYYAYVLRHSPYYKHYAKEYHKRNREVYKYKYKQETLENINKMRKIKIVELRVKIEFPTEENKFIVEI
jgi:hypothetical protein